jgi:hypothetical protein
MHEVISVAADRQPGGSESVYLVSGIDAQQAAVTLIKKDYVNVTEQKLHIAVDHESMIFMCVLYLHAEVTTV